MSKKKTAQTNFSKHSADNVLISTWVYPATKHTCAFPHFLFWEQTLVLEGIQLKSVYVFNAALANSRRSEVVPLHSQIFCMARWRATLLWFMELYAIVVARIKSVRAVEDCRNSTNSTSKNHSFPHPFAHFAHSSLGFSEVQRIHRSMDSVCPATEP